MSQEAPLPITSVTPGSRVLIKVRSSHQSIFSSTANNPLHEAIVLEFSANKSYVKLRYNNSTLPNGWEEVKNIILCDVLNQQIDLTKSDVIKDFLEKEQSKKNDPVKPIFSPDWFGPGYPPDYNKYFLKNDYNFNDIKIRNGDDE